MKEEILAPPTPWEDAAAGLFRLPGFGGAAIFMRSTVLPGPEGRIELGIDFSLLSPESFARYLHRAVSLNLPAQLSQFFLAAGNNQIPEQSVVGVQDLRSGLSVNVCSSREHEVELEFAIQKELDTIVADFDTFNFTTTRAALVQAARDIYVLSNVDVEPDSDLEILEEWS